ncbi:MAG: UDP-N-acetylmuramoyl-L-alanyl-D-glutamate--2,6-diaminopimelate ligase [Lachnospiraceae bacterium]|nr:UDP-N-acetylmuramoyl-L-alanyl-D-glutamate--2,6-diaminopimelate ligase [Lachnospiraceae bacterium]
MKMHLVSEYARLLSKEGMLAQACTGADPEIRYLTYDSRAVVPGTMFICKGAAFKEQYLKDALEKGAVCYASEKAYEAGAGASCLLVKDIRRAMPVLAEAYTNEAWRKLHLIGIGGTKGKSTTAYYMKAIVDDYMEATGGRESGVISSIDTYDGVRRFESHITTPESVELMEHFLNAEQSGITYMEMEVSSQALKYDRVDRVQFEVGMFLNISEDHISPIEHPDFEDYFASKLRIFAQTKNAVVNLDADYADRILREAQVCERVMTFSVKDPSADVYGYDVRKEGQEISFRVRTAEFDEAFRLTMPGLFNVENALAAVAGAILLGIPREYMHSGLLRAKSSGRMETYVSKDGKIICVVDYAHNKLSFEKLFGSTKEEYPEHGIVAIFGCPGKKALLRRKDLGTISGRYSRKVYLCAEDPGAEPVDEISRDIAQYVEAEHCPYEMIEDRGEAIHAAVREAAGLPEGSVLLITGKGNETRQKYGSQYLDCRSDVDYVLEALAAYDAAH